MMILGIGLAIIALFGLFLFPILRVAGECSRAEEEEEFRFKADSILKG